MTNQALVQQFYDEVFSQQSLAHLADYMRADYRQHSPAVADKRAGFKQFIVRFWQLKPKIEILALTSHDDWVQVFFKCTLANGHVNKVCDIYRIEAGKLAEHWDVIEHNVEAKTAVSGNGIF